MKILTYFLLLFAGCILTHPQISLLYAARGLDLWFYKMIPALLPFMILSGLMIRLDLTSKVAMLIHPIIKPIFQVRKDVSYGMLIGFLCGFPMGARVTADLYTRKLISKDEGEYLLAFCNNIGPVYFCSFALPLLKRELVLPYLFGMYGLPLLYGLVLRYTLFRNIEAPSKASKYLRKPELVCCEKAPQKAKALNEAIKSAMDNILLLGGYMIFFNLLNLLPHVVFGGEYPLLSPILEITGGLSSLGASLPLYSLLVLSFGGFSCLAQTYSCICETDLNFSNYILHKVILTVLNGCFYAGWFILSPNSFLK